MAKKARDSKRASMQKSKAMRNLALLPFGALFLKILIIFNIEGFNWYAAANGNLQAGLTELLNSGYQPSNVWYGSDSENYLRGVEALSKDGLFSDAGILSYWPAGYPILMWLTGLFFGGWFLVAVAILQSSLYAFSCWLISVEMKLGRLAKFAFPFLLVLTFNPTLALNTISIGYELPTVSLILIAVALMLRHFRVGKSGILNREPIFAALALMIATFMQPRLIAFAAVIFTLWGVAKFGIKSASLFIALSLGIVAIAPTVMVFRNVNSNGMFTVSTNLGTTMNIGAGMESTGGWTTKATGVKCPEVTGSTAEVDAAQVRCILKWYVGNPKEATRLFWNKSLYFWSPWKGPVANGTMARNPWFKNHPINGMLETEEGYKLVTGMIGKLVSWAWMLATFSLMIIGLKLLFSGGNLERLLGLTCFSVVVVNWLITILTIGDHRFRIPSMGASLLLQVIGLVGLFVKKRDRFRGTPVEVTWAGIHWNRRREADNLPPQNG
jgi:hypothetical protein